MTGNEARAQNGTGHRHHVDLDTVLKTVHHRLGIAVSDRLNAQGGPPELRTPDLALDRLLAATHRTLGTAVGRRLSRDACDALTQRSATLSPHRAARGALSHRPAAIRVKHREEALRLVRRYWPCDIAETMRAAIRIVQDLGALLDDTTQPLSYADAVLDKLRSRLEASSQLPEPHRPAPASAPVDYLGAIEAALADPAERLADELHGIKELLEEELAPTIATLETAGCSYPFGVSTVAQDLIDDLARGCEEADALARAVAEVERASNDFVGADLTNVQLDGLLLDGILWDDTTLWPPHWETRVRRASLLCDEEGGIRVVAAEGSHFVVHAEA
ncbi:hypothetical protein M2155_007999 [Streptomyces sp. SAI-119]|uniref:hypothetical protein n=1 Tax=Streptomyces sp. SAI-119 TaxID=2940541 RepID=UPI002474E56A|nr:hypothetical protein [Streptomyces sp. SAI-119]MDH6455500.1 hypothetical protein [Streptomyces sp. SAI-119]